MFPLLHIGSLSIQTPGLILLLAIWIGLSQSEKHAQQVGVDPNRLDNLVLIALIAGVVGARLAYAAHSLPAFAASPLSLFLPTPSMLDPEGGFVIGVLAAWIFAYRKGMPFWPTLDALTPGLAIFMIGLGLAHLASGDAFGAPTSIPWSIELWGARRHPSQVYEILMALAIAASIWPHNPKAREEPAPLYPAGARFLVFLALSAAARLFLEAFRGDSTLLAGSVRAAQVAAWLVLAVSFWLLGQKIKLPLR